MAKTRLGFSAIVLVSTACLFLSFPPALLNAVSYDDHKRYYKIRNLDPEAVDESTRRLFKPVEYSIKAEKGVLDGASVFIVNRDETSATGDRVEHKFYVEIDTLRMVRVDRKMISRDGKLVESREQYYKNHFYEYEPNTFHMEMLPLAAQKMDLNRGAETEFFVIMSPEFVPWGLYLAVDGEETVTVPAGTFECVRIKVKYKKENLPGFFKKMPSFFTDSLLPDIYLWVEKAEPHMMIKMQGKVDGIVAPEKVHELVKVE